VNPGAVSVFTPIERAGDLRALLEPSGEAPTMQITKVRRPDRSPI
jgi:hypothetical protein